ncbi:MAG: sulfotransferase domain-containing protein [Nitrospirae bacterium]|nr:sulfotransferase domain-containing protein [Nitrospirota bacterium]
MIVNWNITDELKEYKNADIIFLSIGKSGRTWLRVMINKYLSLHYNLPFGLNDFSMLNSDIPSISYSHEAWMHFSEATWLQRAAGKYIIPDKILSKKRIILHARDPRDVVVSLYYHKTKRARKRVQCSMNEFIKHRKFGINNIIFVMNLWHRRLKNHPACLLTHYEDFKRNPLSELIRLMEFIGIKNIDIQKIEEAVTFGDFTNMKRMEAQGEFGVSILRPVDVSDPDSFKVRKGEVGGYKQYFQEADLKYLDNALNRLDDYYMYKDKDNKS